MTLLIDEPASVLRQLEEISEAWAGDKPLPQMRFTLGTLTEACDPAVRLAVAQDPRGRSSGFFPGCRFMRRVEPSSGGL